MMSCISLTCLSDFHNIPVWILKNHAFAQIMRKIWISTDVIRLEGYWNDEQSQGAEVFFMKGNIGEKTRAGRFLWHPNCFFTWKWALEECYCPEACSSKASNKKMGSLTCLTYSWKFIIYSFQLDKFQKGSALVKPDNCSSSLTNDSSVFLLIPRVDYAA